MVTTLKMDMGEKWNALYAIPGPEGTKDALDYMGRALSELSCHDRRCLQAYLTGLMYDRSNGSAPRLAYAGLRIGPVITDLAARLSAEQGGVPVEFYHALGVLPLHDERTRTVLGETLRLKPAEKEVRLARLRDIASSRDAEDAFRDMRLKHGVLVKYAGMERDDAEEQRRRFIESSGHADGHESMAEFFDGYSQE